MDLGDMICAASPYSNVQCLEWCRAGGSGRPASVLLLQIRNRSSIGILHCTLHNRPFFHVIMRVAWRHDVRLESIFRCAMPRVVQSGRRWAPSKCATSLAPWGQFQQTSRTLHNRPLFPPCPVCDAWSGGHGDAVGAPQVCYFDSKAAVSALYRPWYLIRTLHNRPFFCTPCGSRGSMEKCWTSDPTVAGPHGVAVALRIPNPTTAVRFRLRSLLAKCTQTAGFEPAHAEHTRLAGEPRNHLGTSAFG
jgi:hypothetical protein